HALGPRAYEGRLESFFMRDVIAMVDETDDFPTEQDRLYMERLRRRVDKFASRFHPPRLALDAVKDLYVLLGALVNRSDTEVGGALLEFTLPTPHRSGLSETEATAPKEQPHLSMPIGNDGVVMRHADDRLEKRARPMTMRHADERLEK